VYVLLSIYSVGGLVIVGGTIGYLKKGSKASLIAGLTVGSLLLGSSYLIAKTDRVFEGHALATATSGLLAMAMGQRYMQAGKFMPSGIVAVIGAATFAYNCSKAIEWMPSKSD
jgi:uncharacterized membrane protein (UPF0136 family)